MLMNNSGSITCLRASRTRSSETLMIVLLIAKLHENILANDSHFVNGCGFCGGHGRRSPLAHVELGSVPGAKERENHQLAFALRPAIVGADHILVVEAPPRVTHEHHATA